MDSAVQVARKTVRSTAWNSVSFAASKGITFLSTVILARILAPDEFGLLALGLLAINYLEVFHEFGVGSALIYQQGDVEKKSNVAFTTSLTVNALLTLLAFLVAPLAAWFFNEPRVTPIIQALSIVFILSSLGSVHATRLKKELDFRRIFIPEMAKTLAKGAVSIGMALLGFGVWSLVFGQLAGVLTANALYWLVNRWRPSIDFDWKVMRSMLGYGSQMILVDLLGMVHTNIDYLIIGRRMSPAQLGLYTMAFRIPELLILNVCYIVSRALFPAYSKLQGNLAALQQGFLVTLRYVSLITVPVGAGLFLLSGEFVAFFFSEKWAASVPVMQVLSLYALVYSLGFNAGDIFKATGKPWIINVISVVKIAVTVPLLWFAAGISIYAVALGQLAANILLTLVELVAACRIIAISPLQVVKAIFPAVLSALVMLAGTYLLKMELSSTHTLVRLLVVPVVGLGLYLSVLWLAQRDLVLASVQMARSMMKPEPQAGGG